MHYWHVLNKTYILWRDVQIMQKGILGNLALTV